MGQVRKRGGRAYVAYRLEQGYANGTINRELSALKRMFTLARRGGSWAPSKARRKMMARRVRRVRAGEHIAIEVSSGNVFEDLGLPDASERLAKAELARVIRKIIKEKDWTQRRAAEVLRIAAPDVSDLMRGKLARFSQERLERFLNALDMDVHIQIGPRAAGKKQASITVQLVAGFQS